MRIPSSRVRRKALRRLKISSLSAPPRTNMNATALVCLTNAESCRLRPIRNYKHDNLPVQVFPQLISLLSCTNRLIMEAENCFFDGCLRASDILVKQILLSTNDLSMEAELCPLDDRRGTAEVSLKLAVVHFTTTTAYCHLLSTRGEPTKVICRKMILFLLFPGSIIIQHVMAILAIASAIPLVWTKKPQDSTLLRSSLKRAPFILFGAIDQHPSQPKLDNSDRECMVKVMGRAIVVLALGAQCIGSCIVFARRYQHNATTTADWRVFELAIAALLISLLTMVHLFWHPAIRLNQEEILEQSHNDHLTYLDTALLYFWGMPPPPVDSNLRKDIIRMEWQSRALRIYFNAPTTFGAYWAQPWQARDLLFSLMRLFSAGGLVGKLGIFAPVCAECNSTGRLMYEIVASFAQVSFIITTISISAILLVVLSAKAFPAKRKSVRWRWILLQLLVLLPLGALTWGLVGVLSILMLTVTLFPSQIALMFVCQILFLIYELIILAHWPTELECPLLWSDPNANFLWHLM